jgi:hypothetical protein
MTLSGTLGARQQRRIIFFCYGKDKENYQLRTRFIVHHRIVSAVKTADFVSDRMSYIVLRGPLCNIIVLNAHAPGDEKSDISKDSFKRNCSSFCYHFPKYNTKTLIGDFIAKVGERIFSKRQIGMTVYIRIVMLIVLK